MVAFSILIFQQSDTLILFDIYQFTQFYSFWNMSLLFLAPIVSFTQFYSFCNMCLLFLCNMYLLQRFINIDILVFLYLVVVILVTISWYNIPEKCAPDLSTEGSVQVLYVFLKHVHTKHVAWLILKITPTDTNVFTRHCNVWRWWQADGSFWMVARSEC